MWNNGWRYTAECISLMLVFYYFLTWGSGGRGWSLDKQSITNISSLTALQGLKLRTMVLCSPFYNVQNLLSAFLSILFWAVLTFCDFSHFKQTIIRLVKWQNLNITDTECTVECSMYVLYAKYVLYVHYNMFGIYRMYKVFTLYTVCSVYTVTTVH